MFNAFQAQTQTMQSNMPGGSLDSSMNKSAHQVADQVELGAMGSILASIASKPSLTGICQLTIIVIVFATVFSTMKIWEFVSGKSLKLTDSKTEAK
jgi:hypothetical protein